MITYFEKPFGIVCWNEEQKIVELAWKGFTTSEDFRMTMNKALDLLKEKRATRFLSDARLLKLILPEDQAWINTVWTPKMITSGVKKMASLTPESAVARLSIDKMTRQTADQPQALQGFEFSSFQNFEQARKWLLN